MITNLWLNLHALQYLLTSVLRYISTVPTSMDTDWVTESSLPRWDAGTHLEMMEVLGTE